MPPGPEERARDLIDQLLRHAGWAVQDVSAVDQAAARGVPPRSEQDRIVAEVDRRLSIVREVEAEVEANLKRAQALRQAILTKAFAISTSTSPRDTERRGDV